MRKIDPTVWKETKFIALTTLLLGALQQAVFLIIGKWDLTVLYGGIYGWVIALANFFLMALTVQKAVTQEEKDAKNTMKLSQNLRLLGLFLFALIAYLLPFFNTVAAVLPYLYPRFAISLSPILRKE